MRQLTAILAVYQGLQKPFVESTRFILKIVLQGHLQWLSLFYRWAKEGKKRLSNLPDILQWDLGGALELWLVATMFHFTPHKALLPLWRIAGMQPAGTTLSPPLKSSEGVQFPQSCSCKVHGGAQVDTGFQPSILSTLWFLLFPTGSSTSHLFWCFVFDVLTCESD